MKTKLIMLFLALLSVAATARPGLNLQEKNESKDAIYAILGDYILLKDALVKGELSASLKYVKQAKTKFEETNMSLFKGDEHAIWMEKQKEAIKLLQQMIEQNDLGKIRLTFKSLSTEIIALAETFGPFKTTLYVQHCPMADKNTGGDWISLQSEIRNPYFGDMMLNCGSVTQEIK